MLHNEAGRAYVHEVPGAGIRVCLDFGVVDRISSDVLRGLGALPRRGMEVGGLLLGSADARGETVTVSVEDYVAFPCEHLYGPNFRLSPKDEEGFAELVSSWTPAAGRQLGPVGFYRSHTRGDLELTPEDVELLDAWLPQPHAVCLLIRPHATRPAEAAIFTRRNGGFQPGPPASVFPFRRRELGGGSPPRRTAAAPPQPQEAEPQKSAEGTRIETWIHPAPAAAPASKSTGGWLLVLALLAFLLVGIVIGVQVAGLIRPQSPPPAAGDPFALGLSAVQFGGAIHLRWNPQAPALVACRSASLVIRDGPNTKMIDLRKEDLARGALIYQHASPVVSFRLEAILSPANTVSESIDLRLMPPGGSQGTEAADPLK